MIISHKNANGDDVEYLDTNDKRGEEGTEFAVHNMNEQRGHRMSLSLVIFHSWKKTLTNFQYNLDVCLSYHLAY